MSKTKEEIKLALIEMAREDLMTRFQLILETFKMSESEENKAAVFEAQFELLEKHYPEADAITARAAHMGAYVLEEEISQ